MDSSPTPVFSALAQNDAAPQHGPRPLPLFLSILWRETRGDQHLRQRAFAGLRRYQQAPRIIPPPAPVPTLQVGNARMLRYGADNGRSPVIFIPSLINPPQVLDLSKSRSLLRHMAAAGHDAWLVDWGTPVSSDRAMGLDGHVTQRLLPLLAQLPRSPILVGYCLGGTLALAAAMLRTIGAVATIASPWQFDGFTDADRQEIAILWRDARPSCERLGYVPMEVLQSGFWAIDPAQTIRKYAAFADMEEGSDAAAGFMALEDWANSGSPLTFAAARDLFDHLYGANASGQGQWRVGGRIVDPSALSCPSLSIRSTTDRIVPAVVAPQLAENREIALGHVGMVVGGRAREMLWNPLSLWLSSHGG